MTEEQILKILEVKDWNGEHSLFSNPWMVRLDGFYLQVYLDFQLVKQIDVSKMVTEGWWIFKKTRRVVDFDHPLVAAFSNTHDRIATSKILKLQQQVIKALEGL